MPRRIFISYNFNDRDLAHSISSFFQPGGGKCQGKPLFVEKNVSDQGNKAIAREISKVMDNCTIALFVIGDDNHNSPWIIREAELALKKNLGIVAVRHPNSNGGLPKILKKNDIPVVSWDQIELSKVLNTR